MRARGSTERDPPSQHYSTAALRRRTTFYLPSSERAQPAQLLPATSPGAAAIRTSRTASGRPDGPGVPPANGQVKRSSPPRWPANRLGDVPVSQRGGRECLQDDDNGKEEQSGG